MKRRLRRVSWSLRRLRPARLVIGFVLAAVAIGAVWIFTDADLSVIGWTVMILAIGLLLARPAAALWSHLIMRQPSWRVGPTMRFAGDDLGFTVSGRSASGSPSAVITAVATTDRTAPDHPTVLEIWLVAGDAAGSDWTIVSGRPDRTIWSSSVEGPTVPADGNDPYRAAHRLINREWAVPVTAIDVVVRGSEVVPDGRRDVVVVVARTSLSLEEFTALAHQDPGRTAQPVPVSPKGVADALGWGDPVSWRGGAVYGLLEVLEQNEPGSWTELEGRVRARWHDKAMFARVERGTAQITGRVLAAGR